MSPPARALASLIVLIAAGLASPGAAAKSSVSPRSAPPQVCMLLIRAPKELTSCTGTLIRSDIVLTAAHCVPDQKDGNGLKITAHCGYTGGPRTTDSFNEHFEVTGIRTNFSHETAGSDFAFFRLNRRSRAAAMALPIGPERFDSEFLQPSPYSASDQMLKPNTECRFSGYGFNWSRTETWYVTSDESPVNGLNAFKSGPYMHLDSWGQDVGRLRQGDSGGPLYCHGPNSTQWQIVAIVSNGSIDKGTEGRVTNWLATASSEFLSYWMQVRNEWK